MQFPEDACVVVEVGSGARREAAHLRDGHADVEHLLLDELLLVFPQQRGDAPERGRPLGLLHPRPGTLVKGSARCRDSGVDLAWTA